MKRIRPLERCLGGVAIILVVAAAATAHPMGNFAVCHYARLRVDADRVRLRYVLDLAELPAHAEKLAMDADRDGRVSADERSAYLAAKADELSAGLSLTVDGAPAGLARTAADLRFEPGAGGLDTLRIALDLTADLPGGGAGRRFEYRDRNYPARSGWKEVVVQAGGGVAVASSSAPPADRSRELTAYPPDEVPPQDTEARFTTTAGPSTPPPSDDVVEATPTTPRDAFTQAVLAPELGMWVALAGLAVAFTFGALHALSPGHGKAMVAAYLAGTRGTAGHAVLLGLVVTITHTLGVFALGLVTLTLSRFVLPERLYPWLGTASGLSVFGVGVWLLYHRARRLILGPRRKGAGAGAGAGHHHDIPDGPLTLGGLVALGVSGGLVPCPSALVVLLAAVALRRVAYGLLLITAFSAGLAAVLVVIGLLVVWVGRWIDRLPAGRGLLRGLSFASAVIITLIGAGLTARSLADLW